MCALSAVPNALAKGVFVSTSDAVEVAFDPAKDAINTAKHGVSLSVGATIFEDDDHIVLTSIRPVDGEDRYKVIGMIEGKLFTGVHVRRGAAIRFISVRRSNDGESRIYRRP